MYQNRERDREIFNKSDFLCLDNMFVLQLMNSGIENESRVSSNHRKTRVF